MLNCIQTVLAQTDTASCNSLTDSLMLSSGSGPDMAADQFGYIHVVWQDPTLGVMYAQVGPDGTITVPATSMYPGKGYGFPHIAVDRAGAAHIVATTSGSTLLLYMKVSGGQRVTFNAFYMNPTLADNETDSSPSITINPVTQLPVVVAEVQTELDEWEGIFYPVLVPVYSTFIASVALDSGGNPVRGSIFDAWYDLDTASPQFDVSYPSVAVDAHGVTHVVWEYQDTSLTGLTVGYANSASTYWEEIADTANVNGLAGRPIIIRGADGNLDVVWSTTHNAVVWTEINPAGLIMIDNAIVSQPAAIPRWPGLASGSGQLVCSWTDGREGTNSQIYARSLLDTLPECDVSESPGAALNGAVAIGSSGNTAYVWQDQRSGSSQLYYRATSNVVTIVGQVSSTCDGSPIAGASVQIGTYSATSDTEGSYSIRGIPPGTYSVTVSQPNYITTNTAVTIPSGTSTATDDFMLRPAQTLAGEVVDGATGKMVAGALVQFETSSTVTDSAGQYSFCPVAVGDYTLTASKTAYVPANVPVSVVPGAALFRVITLQPTNATPTVTAVSSGYSGICYFLDGVSFPVTFVATVDWAGHPPGIVRFITPLGGDVDIATSGSTASEEIDVGNAFGPGRQLQVQAISSDGTASIALVGTFAVMAAIPNVLLKVVVGGDHFYYQSTLAPSFQFLNAGLPPGVTFNPAIPLFGDNPFHLSFLPSLDITVNGNHAVYQLEVSGDSIPKVDLAGQELDFTPRLEASGDYDAAAGQWNWGGSLGLDANLDISKSWPFVVTLGPFPILMFAKADLDLKANATLSLLNLYPITLNGTLRIDPEVTGTLGVGVDSVIAVAGWISGGADFTFQYPHAPPLTQYDIHLRAGVTAYAWLFKWQDQLFHWDWPDGNGSPHILSLLSLSKSAYPQPYPRDYSRRHSYGLFSGHPSVGIGPAGFKPKSLQNASLYALQTQVFPFSEPSVAANGTNCYAVWLHDDPSRSVNNRTMLVFSKFDETNWSAFTPVADDGTADFHPQLRAFSDGSAVVTWENEAEALATNATFAEMTTNLGIATDFYDPVTAQWQPMQQLTTNNYLHRSPRIAGPIQTNLMLVWIANPANDIEGNSTNINQLWFTTWNGSAWSVPQMFASVPYPLLKYDLSYDGTNAFVVMSVDSDNTLTNVNAHELFAMSFQNNNWSSLQQLTKDEVPNDNPQMAIDPNGHIVLLWLKGGEMSSVLDFNFANRQVIRTNEYSSNLGDFKLARGSDGRLAVIWAEPSANPSDLWAMFYDPVFKVWGSTEQLTDDPQTEMETAATFYRTNQLVAIYDRVDIAIGTNQIGSVITNADLYVLQYQLSGDLALMPNSLRVSPANPTPGDTVMLSVIVENLGDSGVSNVLVAFYQGDPAKGGTEIGQTNLAIVLPPGATSTVSIPWTVPATTNALPIYALVDPNQQFSDSDRLNNEVSSTFVEPDLAVQSVTWSQITSNLLSVTATIVNQGTIASQPATVSFLLNSLTGTNLFTTNIASLAPGQSIDVNFLWTVWGLGNGLSLFAVVNGGTNALDFNPQNNALQLTIQPNRTQVNVELGPVLLLSGGAVHVGVTGLAGQTYPIQASTNLVNWYFLTNITLTNMSGQFIDLSATNYNRRFYRAVVP
jgi:hypothetical protein